MQNFKNFIIAFVAGLLLFGAFAFTIPSLIKGEDDSPDPDATEVIAPDDTEKNPDKEDTPDDTEVIQSPKSFTAVIGGYDNEKGELDGLVFLKADAVHNRFIVAAIPTSLSVVVTGTDPVNGTTVKTNVRIKDFPILYRDSERNTRIVDTVHAMTGMEIDYYAFFDTNAALGLFEKTGGLYYDVPQDMVYIGNGTEEAPEIQLKAGAQVLGKNQILGLLRFSYYTTDERRNAARRAAVQADFISEALGQLVKLDSAKLIDGAASVLSTCETNFTVADLRTHFELISKFSEYHENNIIMTVDLADPLEYTYAQRLFENYK